MDEAEQAERWVREELDRARAACAQRPPGPRDLTLEQYETVLRTRAETCLRPTDPYVGRHLQSAYEAARDADDDLCVHRGPTGHRADWRADRVHVELDADDVVRSARRNLAPWSRGQR